MARVRCPQCKAVASLPDEAIGRRIRCTSCETAFAATPFAGTQKSADTNPFDYRRSAADTLVPPPPRVRKQQAARSGLGVGWVLAALAAFLLPVAGAAGFVALKWKRGKSGDAAGERFAAMKLGSKGSSCVLFEVFPDEDYENDFLLLEENGMKTDLGADLGKTGTFSDKGLAKAAREVKKFYDLLTQEKKVPPENIYLVGSTSLVSVVRKRKDLSEAEKTKLIAENRRRLAAVIKEKVGLTVDLIDQHDEDQYEIEGLIRSRDRDVGMYLNVGSGATRGAYVSSRTIKHVQLAGVTAARERLLTLQKESPDEAVVRLGKEDLRPALRKQIAKDPELMKRQKVYLVGGITWVMATCQHPRKCLAKRGTYVKLGIEDIEAFRKNVAGPGHYLERYKLPEGLTQEEQKELKATLKKQTGFFKTREHLIAGAEILYSVARELELEQKTVWFHRNGHVVWLQSYIEEHGGLK